MTRVHIALHMPVNYGATGETMPVVASQPEGGEILEADDTSVAGDVVCPENNAIRHYWTVTNMGDVTVWVSFDTDPEAVVGEGWPILPQTWRDFGARQGQRCAVIEDDE